MLSSLYASNTVTLLSIIFAEMSLSISSEVPRKSITKTLLSASSCFTMIASSKCSLLSMVFPRSRERGADRCTDLIASGISSSIVVSRLRSSAEESIISVSSAESSSSRVLTCLMASFSASSILFHFKIRERYLLLHHSCKNSILATKLRCINAKLHEHLSSFSKSLYIRVLLSRINLNG